MKNLSYIVFICFFFLYACTTGTSMITRTVRSPINFEEVKILHEWPENKEVIGNVTSKSSEGLRHNPEKIESALIELKKQAAKIGANAIFIKSIGNPENYEVESNGGVKIRDLPIVIKGIALYITSP